MPAVPGADDAHGSPAPKLSLSQRLLLTLPRVRHGRDEGRDKEPVALADRLRKAFLKPEPPGARSEPKPSDIPASIDELQETVRSINEKERIIGLLAAPVAAAIGFAVINALIANDPAALLKNGQVNRLHVSVSLYHELELVLLGLALLMLVMALLRKRLYLGIVTGLYGLAVFNLHYWGFGIPFVMVGAWYLVRAYRYQRAWREATGGRTWRGEPGRGGSALANGRPGTNKRYTQPASIPKRPPAAKATKQRAG